MEYLGQLARGASGLFTALLLTGALGLGSGYARAEDESLELDSLREQNELLQQSMQRYDDALMALQDQNESLQRRVEGMESTAGAGSTEIDVAAKPPGLTEGWDIGAHFMLRHKYFKYSEDKRGVDQHGNNFAQYRALLTFSKAVTEALDFTFQFGAGQGAPAADSSRRWAWAGMTSQTIPSSSTRPISPGGRACRSMAWIWR